MHDLNGGGFGAAGGLLPTSAQRKREVQDLVYELNQLMWRYQGSLRRVRDKGYRRWQVNWRGRPLLDASRYGSDDEYFWNIQEAEYVARRLLKIAKSWEGYE